MKLQNHHKEAFNKILEVTKWWSKDIEGSSKKRNDEFVICHPGRHFSKQKLVEVVPNKKVVWLVTESQLGWIEKDKHDWINTKMNFEITGKGDNTVLRFTHEDLVPEKECYEKCAEGWNMVIKDWLFNFITTGKTIKISITKMENKDLHRTITANVSPENAFKAICKVNEWWSKNIEGKTEKLGDVFTYHSRDTWVIFKITECVAVKKIVWHATDCYLHSFEDKTEWRNTDVIFEIIGDKNFTEINFIHVCLVPEVECYERCVKGWDQYFIGSLLKMLTTGKGRPAEIKFWENVA